MSMRSPFHTPQNHLSPPKPPTTTFQTTNHIAQPQFGYEPTSVLEQRRSPSPVSNFPVVSGLQDEWDEHAIVLPLPPSTTNHPLSLDDWDSMMLGLPEKDDSTFVFKNMNTPPQFHQQLPHFELEPPPQIPTRSLVEPFDNNIPSSSPLMLEDFDFNLNHLNLHNNSNDLYQVEQSNTNANIEFDCSQLEQLIKAAAFVESNDTPSARVILARLNQPLQRPDGKPLQRSAFYFKEALQFFINGSNLSELRLSPWEIVHEIKAYKAFSEVSPINMFANCTANQTLLEALEGGIFIHIVDFEIGLGGQWASFMQEIASKAKTRGVLPASLRITAVISEEGSIEARLNLIRENLGQFAFELGIQFQLDFVLFSVFQHLSFNSVRFINGELIAMNLSPTIFRRLTTIDAVSNFLRFVRRIAPRITVFVDFEGCSREARGSSFRRNFVNGLEFYSSLLESLDVASSGDADFVRRVETFLLRQKIFASVFAAGSCNLPWRDIISGVGLVPVQFSEFTNSQADWLVRRAQVRGFHVAKRQGSMLLCWRERELVATSAWRC